MDKFRNRRRKSKATYGSGGDFYRPEMGHTALLICPPTEDMEGCPYVEIEQHFGISPTGGGMSICLVPNDSSDLDNPVILAKYEALRKEPLDLSKGCPVCERLGADELPPELLQVGKFGKTRAENMEGKGSWYFAVVPMGMIRGGELHPFPATEQVPRVYPAGFEAWDAICDVIDLNGEVWDLDAACLVVLSKDKGTRIKYSASAYGETVKNPMRIPKPIRFAIKKGQKPGGDLDLFRIVAGMIKKHEDVVSIMTAAESSTKPAGDQNDGRPPCYGIPEQYEENDPDCKEQCDSFDDCGRRVAEQTGGKPKKRGTVEKPKATSKDEPPKTRTKKRGASKPKPKPEPEPPEHDPEDDLQDFSGDVEDPPPKEEPEGDDGDDGGNEDTGSSEEEIDDFEAELRKARKARGK